MASCTDFPGSITMPGPVPFNAALKEVLGAYARIGLSNSWISRPELYTVRTSGDVELTFTRSGVKRKSSAVRETDWDRLQAMMPRSSDNRRISRDRLFKKAVRQGRSERGAEAYPLGYVEAPSDARTMLAGFFNSLSDVRRSIVTFPLDAAPNAESLVAVDRLTGEHCLDGGAEIAAGYGLVVAGSALIYLSMVGQSTIAIKKIEIRGTGSAIGLRDLLRLIVTEWKREFQTLGHFFEP